MTYDFHKLKTVSFADGEVKLRIPRRWDVWPDETRAGYWGCYEEEVDGRDTDSGTLWVQVDHYDWDGDDAPPTELCDMNKMAEEAAQSLSPDHPPLLESAISPVDQGCRWHRVFDTVEDGEPLRFWFSSYFLNRGPHTAIIAFNLVLTHAQMDDPAFVELREIMMRELDNVSLDPFRAIELCEAEEAFGKLVRVNFDAQVLMILPAAMTSSRCDDDNGLGAQHAWYCRLDDGRSHAGMFVFSDDLRFQIEGDDEEGAEFDEDELTLAALERLFPEVPASWTDVPGAKRMPWGMVFYEVTDEENDSPAAGENDGPLRNHLWKVLCREGLRNRRVQVLLMVPLAEVDNPFFQQLVAYMHRAVRRAEFPGFEGTELQ